VSAGVFHVAFGAVAVLANVVAIQQLGGAAAAGLVASATGAGGAVGAVVAMRTRPRRPLATGVAALAGMPVYVLVFAGPAPLAVVMAVGAAAFAGLMFYSVCWDTALQDHVPHESLGRVSSWDILTSFVGILLGNALAGPLADAFGTSRVLVVAAAVTGVAALAPLALSGVRRLPAGAVGAADPVPALP
jgi:predicted MFS family arabinose efflux permease